MSLASLKLFLVSACLAIASHSEALARKKGDGWRVSGNKENPKLEKQRLELVNEDEIREGRELTLTRCSGILVAAAVVAGRKSAHELFLRHDGDEIDVFALLTAQTFCFVCFAWLG